MIDELYEELGAASFTITWQHDPRGLLDAALTFLADLRLLRPVPGGVLVLHSVTATTWQGPAAPVQTDLCPGRPLRGGSWCALLDARGYHASVQPGPGEADYLVTAIRA